MVKFAWYLVTALVVLLGWSREASASHFRYGTINWRVPDAIGAPRTVEFTVQQAWRSDFVACDELDFGDGSFSGGCGTATTIGTGTDAGGAPYTVQQYIVTHTYTGAATEFDVFFTNCCRISTLESGADGTYRVETHLSLAGGNTGGPVSASPAVRQMQVGNVRTLFFPLFDPDGDAVSCRFGTDTEAGFANSIPFVAAGGAQATVAASLGGCTVSWDVTQGTAGDRHAAHLVFESVHGGQTSSTHLDLIIELVTPPPPVCTGGGSFTVDPGEMLNLQTSVTDPGAAAGNTTLTVINAPPTALSVPAPGTSLPAPWSSLFTWTPTAADAGSTQVVVINYTNSINLTGSCFVTILVAQCEDAGDACTVGVGGCEDTGINVCAGPGVTVCSAEAGVPSLEICDEVDNDCDGSTDEGFVLGGACTVGVGECAAAGVEVCSAGGIGCDAVPGDPELELCDGLDNDCDGTADNGNPQGDLPCVTGLLGECAMGTSVCTAGAVACVGPEPTKELCEDALDSDCDGLPSNDCTDDIDGDGLKDDEEEDLGTDPEDADSDDDGVVDGVEIDLADDTDGDGLINALDPDSDDDGLFDGTESGNDCSNPDTDPAAGNCIEDADPDTTTSPVDADTDDGSVSDGDEDANHNGRVDEGEKDPNVAADDITLECENDDACGEDEICEDNECVAGCRTDAECGTGEVCENDECVVGCRNDEDCSNGQACVEPTPVGECADLTSDLHPEGAGLLSCTSSRSTGGSLAPLVGFMGLALGLLRRRRRS